MSPVWLSDVCWFCFNRDVKAEDGKSVSPFEDVSHLSLQAGRKRLDSRHRAQRSFRLLERAAMCEAAPQRGFLTRIKALQMLIDVHKVLPVRWFVLRFKHCLFECVQKSLKHVCLCIYPGRDWQGHQLPKKRCSNTVQTRFHLQKSFHAHDVMMPWCC